MTEQDKLKKAELLLKLYEISNRIYTANNKEEHLMLKEAYELLVPLTKRMELKKNSKTNNGN